MTQYPNGIDTDLEIPRIDNNITEAGGDAINALRSSTFAIEGELGTNPSGTAGSVAQRLNNALTSDGLHILPSALVGAGLITLPITDIQISPTANILESKLSLSYSTTSLFNLYTTLKTSVDILNGFLSLTGIKLEPHIDGTNYNHLLSAIHVDSIPAIVKTAPTSVPSAGTNVINRNSTNADLLIKDLSDDLVVHEKSDGTAGITATSGGTIPPQNFAHMGSGIYVDPTTFSTIPQTNNDIQKIVEYIDSSSLLLLGGRTQNLYANGIPRTSRSVSLLNDGYGAAIIPPTPVIAYFLNVPPGPEASSPVDDFSHGDDVIQFNPTASQLSTFNFDAQFAQVQPGDLITVNYGTGISFQFLVDSIKSVVNNIPNPPVRTYSVRINGKNPIADGYATARIDKSVFNRNKYGVLASAIAPNNLGAFESVIVANPKSAIVLGNGFYPDNIDALHYNLHLTLLPNGDLSNVMTLPAIDVSGNQGATPGKYTLRSVIDAANTAFRAPGFNYRFIAFDYNGQFGIMLADPYNNAAFSIIGGAVDTNGNYAATSTSLYPSNIVDNFNVIDPLGLGISGANVASPAPSVSYVSVNAARFAPTLFFYPLRRNFFYTDGVEKDSLNSDPLINGNQDGYGFGYWPAIITSVNVLASRVQVVYKVNLDLEHTGLQIGKTLVVQPSGTNAGNVNYGRFLIENISFSNCDGPSGFTTITVYDAVHGSGISPSATAPVNTNVNLYFSDDSVSFDAENVFDSISSGPFKRFFEIYVDRNGHTQTHERARFATSGANISNINLYRVSPKLRGYFTNNDKEIRLKITSYDQTTGNFSGALSTSTSTHPGPTTNGKKGDIVRFYDETNIDFIDFIFSIDDTITTFSNQTIDIQLFKSLELNEELYLLSSCQINDTSKTISYLKDERQFGNVSEEQFTNSALDYISSSDKLLRENGIINGFDNPAFSSNTITFNGGAALVNGKIIMLNNVSANIPKIVEVLSPGFSTTVSNINWFVCVNDRSEIELIASTDYAISLSGTYGSLDQNRLFYVLNQAVAVPTPYSIKGSYLADIVDNRKYLTPIYFISATTTGTGSSVATVINSMTDMRRFVCNGYGGLSTPFVFGPNSNFRSFDSLNVWLTQLNNTISAQNLLNDIGSKVIVRGNTNLTSQITFDYNYPVIFEGDDGTLNTTATIGFNIGNNITIKNINFIASSAPTTKILSFSGNTAHIIGNTFTRGSHSLTAYIDNPGGADQIITNNIFDGYTVDGTNETLVSNLTTKSRYERNKNQTGYTIFSLSELDGGFFDTNTSPSTLIPFLGNGFPSYAASVLSLSGSGFHTVTGNASILINDKLPTNVQLLYIASSVAINSNLTHFSSGSLHFILYPVLPINYSISNPPTSFAGSIVDVSATLVGSSASSNTLTLSSTFNTQYVYKDLSASNLFTSPTQSFYLVYVFDLESTTGNSIGALFSPIAIKYRILDTG